jgi:hypothetical protein
MSEQESNKASSEESSVDVRIVRQGKRYLAEGVYIQELAEGTGSVDSESETRPKCVIHITVNTKGPTEVRVVRTGNQKVKVYSEHRVKQETVDYSGGTERYTQLWREDGKPVRFHIEIREGTPPPSLATYQWTGPGLPVEKIDKPKEFKREEPESDLSSI